MTVKWTGRVEGGTSQVTVVRSIFGGDRLSEFLDARWVVSPFPLFYLFKRLQSLMYTSVNVYRFLLTYALYFHNLVQL